MHLSKMALARAVEQSIEWYHAMDTMKVPTKMVVYPHGGHLSYRSADARDYTLRTLEWL